MTQVDYPLSQAAPDQIQQQRDHAPPKGHRMINVGGGERTLSAATGALLAIYGLSRRSLPGLLLTVAGADLIKRGVTGHCELYHLAGINTARGTDEAPPSEYFQRGIHVSESFTIEKLPWELYSFWRDFRNLPRIMSHLQHVECLDDLRSHWVAKGPAGMNVEWDAQIINDEPNALIAWRSLGNADVDNAGSVRFVPGPEGRGTEVKVVIDYIPPAGRIGSWIAKLFGEEPEQQIREDLRRFKRLMETGEIPGAQGQPGGSCT